MNFRISKGIQVPYKLFFGERKAFVELLQGKLKNVWSGIEISQKLF